MPAHKGWDTQGSLPESLPTLSLEVAERELGETEERRAQALREMQDLLRGDKFTSDIDFEPDFLSQYLRHAKYDVSRAVRRFRDFLALRRKHESMFEPVPDDTFLSVESSKFVYMLPQRCPQGCAVVCHDFGKWDYSEMAVDIYKRIGVTLVQQSLRDPMSQIHGYKVILNYKDTSIMHLRHCTPSNIQLFYQMALNCYPMRYKEIYIVPHTPIFKLMWQLMKGLVSEKLRSRIKFVGRPEDLAEHFPPEMLPSHYGGTLNYDPTDWLRRISKDHAHFGMGGQPNYY